MISDDDLLTIAAGFREGIIDDRSSHLMCAAVCWPLASLLKFYGVDCETVESELDDCNHIWIRLADGRTLDPTADQFNVAGSGEFPSVYLGPPLRIHK